MVKIQCDKIFQERISNSFKNIKKENYKKIMMRKTRFLILKNFLQIIRKLEPINIF